jgi:hypothetical protein
MVQIYYEVTIYIYKEIFPSGASLPNPHRRVTPPALPRVEECALFQGVKSSWGINVTKNKDL